MDIRNAARSRFGGWASEAMRRANARHPWSHNDAFHSWIGTRLPSRPVRALDVGCGRGELIALLAERFDQVEGLDVDPAMREASASRCAGLPHVSVSGLDLADVPAGADLVTMIATLHHLELDSALTQVRRILSPGGRFLCVGLARPVSVVDHVWDVASMVTNPVIGYVRHPWVSSGLPDPPSIPVKDPERSFDEIRSAVDVVMPGAQMRRHLAFRHTIEWTSPG